MGTLYASAEREVRKGKLAALVEKVKKKQDKKGYETICSGISKKGG